MHPLIEELEDLFAGSAGTCPHEVAVNTARYLAMDRYARQQSPANVAIGDGSDHAPLSVTGEQDPQHVGVKPLERFFDRSGFRDG